MILKYLFLSICIINSFWLINTSPEALQCYICENCVDEEFLELKTCEPNFEDMDMSSGVSTKGPTSGIANNNFEYSYEDINEELQRPQNTSIPTTSTPQKTTADSTLLLTTTLRPTTLSIVSTKPISNINTTTSNEFDDLELVGNSNVSLTTMTSTNVQHNSINVKNLTITDGIESTEAFEDINFSNIRNNTEEDNNKAIFNGKNITGAINDAASNNSFLSNLSANTNFDSTKNISANFLNKTSNEISFNTSQNSTNIIASANNTNKTDFSHFDSENTNLTKIINNKTLDVDEDTSIDEFSAEVINASNDKRSTIFTTITNNDKAKLTTKSLTNEYDDGDDYYMDNSEDRKRQERTMEPFKATKLQQKTAACYVMQIKVNNSLVVKRGCTTIINENQYLNCQSLKPDITTKECRVCTFNGCNQYLVDYNDWNNLPGEGFWNVATPQLDVKKWPLFTLICSKLLIIKFLSG